MLIINANAIIDAIARPNTCVRLSDGIVVQIGTDLEPQENEQVIDFAGDYLTCGFVDVHIHAFRGMDTMQGEQAVRHMSRELKKVGVAAFLPTTMSASASDTLAALSGIAAVMASPEKCGATVLGAHMEAPFLQAEKCGAQLKEFFTAPTMAAFNAITGPYKSIVKLITLAPELDGAMAFIKAATEEGISVSLGHTSADAETAHQAADHGANHVTHTFNAQMPLNHRAPGVPGAALCDDRLYAEFIADGIHLHPDILKLAYRCKTKDKLVLITDAMEAAGMPDGTYQLGGQTVYVKDNAARLASGVLAGSTLLMHKAVTNMTQLGIPFTDAVTMATVTPAASIGLNAHGNLAVGAKVPLNRFNIACEHIEVV